MENGSPGLRLPAVSPAKVVSAVVVSPASSAVNVGARIHGLDGLRAVAVGIVLVAHFGLYRWVPGGLGVTLFFFISGLLITRLMMAEHQREGHLNVWHFYIRRFLRLYPALLASVVASALLYPVFNGHVTWGEVAAVVFYYANFYNIDIVFLTQGNAPDHGSFATFGVLWSLAVEEQYYLLFPLPMLWLLKDRRKMALCFGAMLVACLLWRITLFHIGYRERIYSSTDTRIDSILYGAFLAVLLSRDASGGLTRVLGHPLAFALGLAGLVLSLVVRSEEFRSTWRYTVQGLALMPILTAICFADGLQRLRAFLEWRPMVWMGGLSYSLYIFHGHAIVIGENLFKVDYTSPVTQLPPGYFLTVIPLTFAFAAVSYYWVEKPFFALRVRFGSNVRP